MCLLRLEQHAKRVRSSLESLARGPRHDANSLTSPAAPVTSRRSSPLRHPSALGQTPRAAARAHGRFKLALGSVARHQSFVPAVAALARCYRSVEAADRSSRGHVTLERS